MRYPATELPNRVKKRPFPAERARSTGRGHCESSLAKLHRRIVVPPPCLKDDTYSTVLTAEQRKLRRRNTRFQKILPRRGKKPTTLGRIWHAAARRSFEGAPSRRVAELRPDGAVEEDGVRAVTWQTAQIRVDRQLGSLVSRGANPKSN